uniref:hypothetical protein n=1 Tax=Jiulongibacter sediminis TaxID=1605367 RepID=UPI0026F31980
VAKDDKERKDYALLILKYYRYKAVTSYEYVSKDGSKVNQWIATDEYPMYAIDEGTFGKLYLPKEAQGPRFMYWGKKPDSYLHGLLQHKNRMAENQKKNDAAIADAEAAGSEEKVKKLPTKLSKLILCSGGTDTINVTAALGIFGIWKNSETDPLSWEQYKEITSISYNFLQLQDIDATGREAAMKLATQYLEVQTVHLPAYLQHYASQNGKRMKDVRDFLTKWGPNKLKQHVEDALPFKFWDEEEAKNDKGESKYRFGRKQYIYDFNQVRGFNFLQMNGFWRLADPKEKTGFVFIHIQGQIVKTVTAQDIKDFITDFLKQRRMSEDLRNKIYRTPHLNEQSLSNLEYFEPNFKYYGPDYQYFCFEQSSGKHIIYKATANTLEPEKVNDVHFWEEKILKLETSRNNKSYVSDFKPLDPFFEISKQDTGDYSIRFSEEMCDFQKFLIGTSRLHWRTELEERMEFYLLKPDEQKAYADSLDFGEEDIKNLLSFQKKEKQEAYIEKYKWSLDGPLLTDHEVAEQHQCMVNRIYMIGYLMHRYKNDAQPWAAFLMDYRVSEESASNGRAGKGLIAKALYRFLRHFHRDGRKQGLLDYEHIFDGVDENTELVHFEDWDAYQPFPRLYTPLTSSLTSNPKGKQQVTYSYPQYGKFLIDTNFADRYTDGSSKGRKLYSVFSDYFHEDLDQYREVRTPETELGRRLYDKRGWDAQEWNRFYNFMIQCLQFYLSVEEKIHPPFTNITKRNNLAVMGESFQGWADTFFENNFNKNVVRTEASDAAFAFTKMKHWSPQLFLKKLIAWCEYNDYELNPEDLKGWRKGNKNSKYGQIKLNVEKPGEIGKYTTAEFIHVRNRNHDSYEQSKFNKDLFD